MSSLTPATLYTVKVYAVREAAKSAPTTTEFTTGKVNARSPFHTRAERHCFVSSASVVQLHGICFSWGKIQEKIQFL